MNELTTTIVIELPKWLYYLMAINLAVSVATLVLRIVDRIDRPNRPSK